MHPLLVEAQLATCVGLSRLRGELTTCYCPNLRPTGPAVNQCRAFGSVLQQGEEQDFGDLAEFSSQSQVLVQHHETESTARNFSESDQGR